MVSYNCTISSLKNEDQILERKISMIPIVLELFGQRQKFQNFNSSRFAKILKLKFKVYFIQFTSHYLFFNFVGRKTYFSRTSL